MDRDLICRRIRGGWVIKGGSGLASLLREIHAIARRETVNSDALVKDEDRG